MNQEQKDLARKDFELGLMFSVSKMFPGGENGGCLQKDSDGLYLMEHIESCWRGFLIAKKQENGQLMRFDATRYITTGMVNRINEFLGNKLDEETMHDVIRAVLTVVGDTPS